MKPLLLEPYFIFILLFIISTIVSTCFCVEDSLYANCDKSSTCIITINSIKYRVLDWNNAAQILTVAREDYLSENSLCVRDYKNNSFDNTPFQYVDSVLVNVTIFYDCPSNSAPTIPMFPPLNTTTCDRNENVFYTVMNLPSSYSAPCTVVVIPILQTNMASAQSAATGISEALNGGFELKWNGNYDACKTCSDSGKECVYSGGNFQCLCEDGSDSTSCKGKRKVKWKAMILIIVPTMVSVTLFFVCYYLIKRKPRKSIKSLLRENFGNESGTIEHLQFNLATLKAATNNFSHENRIGKGGFGEVYKGILPDGRQIAVKRLSKCSTQGVNEFKTEVMVIAKLQHKNLVTLIGFYLDEENKILIYEYVSNKSLDYFLFDSQRSKVLSWFKRYNIIGGIARGLLYLHEHSRLKVIHRDLKPSNVLLDENMTPKISDFGLAKIVEINQDQKGTNRIVGTFGYMPPEYAMLGQFSEKSDVFSFGVMILEIITGKKHLSSCEPHRIADGLLNYVWRQWRDQVLISILDPSIKENCSEIEVIKCIQIGLLCVQQNPDARPSMSTVVPYFSSNLVELPTPKEPAFFVHGEMDRTICAEESRANQLINRSIPSSNAKMSTSDFFPR